jgi:hypothetical protein
MDERKYVKKTTTFVILDLLKNEFIYLYDLHNKLAIVHAKFKVSKKKSKLNYEN